MLVEDLFLLETSKIQELISDSCEIIKKDIPEFLHSYYRCMVNAKIVSDEVILLISINDDYLTNDLNIDYKNKEEYINYTPPKHINGFNVDVFFYKKNTSYSKENVINTRLETIFNKEVILFPMKKMW